MPEVNEKSTADAEEASRSGHDTLTPAHDKSGTPREIGGRDGPDPTRYGDWEKAGRCIDF